LSDFEVVCEIDLSTAVSCSADGDVVAAFRYEKSFTVDRTSPRTVTNCIHRCWAFVYCQPTYIYRT